MNNDIIYFYYIYIYIYLVVTRELRSRSPSNCIKLLRCLIFKQSYLDLSKVYLCENGNFAFSAGQLMITVYNQC